MEGQRPVYNDSSEGDLPDPSERPHFTSPLWPMRRLTRCREVVKEQVITPVPLKSWLLVLTRHDKSKAIDFPNMMKRVGPPIAIEQPQAPPSPVVDERLAAKLSITDTQLATSETKLAASEAKLASSGEKLSLEKEKLRIQQEHDALVRRGEDLEKQLGEQKMAIDQQRKRYEDMEVSTLCKFLWASTGELKVNEFVNHTYPLTDTTFYVMQGRKSICSVVNF